MGAENRGISTLGLLGVVFITLKLTGYIGWSWWLVLLPFYFGLAALLIVYAGVFVSYMVMRAMSGLRLK